jgi:redox-sensitive bicupin YhaK (pirin superfamily)
MTKQRYIIKTIEGVKTQDGAGVNLTRIIRSPDLNMLDPFLLLDELGSENPNDYIGGFPPHPHIGFETITYMLNGKFRYKDTAGNEGYLSDGSVQWMTAGKGVVHSEIPEQTEGLVRGFQLWLNLPKDKKMIEPAYNDIPAKDIPIVKIAGGDVKIISGEFLNVKGPGKPHTEMSYFDIRLGRNATFSTPIKEDWNCFLYVYEGELIFNKKIKKGTLAVMNTVGEFESSSNTDDTRFILVAGMPLNEPVARGGPFVMNTKAEILQAFKDYQMGLMG